MERTALVTGGTRGIGAGVARALLAAGHRVAVSYAGNDTAAAAFEQETGIPAFRWDVADGVACRKGIARVEDVLGPIDILVNNAGIASAAAFHRMDAETWRKSIDVNLNSLFNMCRPVIEGMRQRGFGRIINLSSINAQRGEFANAHYAAAKAGVLGFTKALAQEGAGRNITVNAISPGYVETEMSLAIPATVLEQVIQRQIPAGRLAAVSEIARAVVFLAADDAGFITGATLNISGGQLMV
ncbi:MAG: 3-oxoacyl-ACP reductase [Rhodobiaceae bacterium]|nr:3-oxoacyl-ACP reductase [Rhodobiaceae bacterium]MCC0056816.1 3-oxoacyl-ACP reductase [Rhodobiaceae bacterium]